MEYRNVTHHLLSELYDEVTSCSDQRAKELCILVSTLIQHGRTSTEGMPPPNDDPTFIVTLGVLVNHLLTKNDPCLLPSVYPEGS